VGTSVVRRVNPHTIAEQERRAKALRLRAAKLTYQKIAEECGYYDRTSAARAVRQALREVISEPAQELIQMELNTLEQLQRPLMLRALKGDVQAAMGVLKIMERRAKMLGLDVAPKGEGDENRITEVIIDSSILESKVDHPVMLEIES
jgi:AraC-like DNA-binding protein